MEVSTSPVSIDDCYFYHTIDLPGIGTIEGEWDLRAGAHNYIGKVDVKGKTVLEMGTANGFLSFYMEQQGADVISYDLSPEFDWDVVPYASKKVANFAQARKNHIRQINNAYRFCHNALQSKARPVHGTVYDIPSTIGLVDITTFGSILLHVENPFRALHQASIITKETIIVTDIIDNQRQLLFNKLFGWMGNSWVRRIRSKILGPSMIFRPVASVGHPEETWWHLTPELIEEYLRVLGFADITFSYHQQPFVQHDKTHFLYTIVAKRTQPIITS